MAKNKDVIFKSSSIEIPQLSSSPPTNLPFSSLTLNSSSVKITRPSSCPFSDLSLCSQTLNSTLLQAKSSFTNFIHSLKLPPLLFPSTLPPLESTQSRLGLAALTLARKEVDKRVLVSEVLIRNKDGEELERKYMEFQKVEPNQELCGLMVEGTTVLPPKFIEDSFRDGFGKVINIRRLHENIKSINDWYTDHGYSGKVLGAELLSGGMLRLQISEAKVKDISIRFLDRKTQEPTVGKTKVETIRRLLTTKKGQVYDSKQAERDKKTVSSMGITEKVSISALPAGDTGDVDLVIDVVECVSRRRSGGVKFANGITSGLLSGLTGCYEHSDCNLFGKNQKLKMLLEWGPNNSTYQVNHIVPGIEGDDKRIQSSIMIQNSKTHGNLVHGENHDNSILTIGRLTSAIGFSRRLLSPKMTGTAGLTFQHVDARDEQGDPVTASGNTHDDMLLAKGGFVYTDDLRSSMFALSMEQGLPILPGLLSFNRVNVSATKSVELGHAKLHLSFSGGNVQGNFPPHEAFPLGGTNSVRGYEEGAIGSGRSYVVGSGEISVPLNQTVDGVLFVDYGSDIGSGERWETRSGYGYGSGLRVKTRFGVLRFEFALNDKGDPKLHFGVSPN